MPSEEDYIGDLPAHVHSTAFKHKQITKGGALLILHPVSIYLSNLSIYDLSIYNVRYTYYMYKNIDIDIDI